MSVYNAEHAILIDTCWCCKHTVKKSFACIPAQRSIFVWLLTPPKKNVLHFWHSLLFCPLSSCPSGRTHCLQRKHFRYFKSAGNACLEPSSQPVCPRGFSRQCVCGNEDWIHPISFFLSTTYIKISYESHSCRLQLWIKMKRGKHIVLLATPFVQISQLFFWH